jgi:hypothetical protein
VAKVSNLAPLQKADLSGRATAMPNGIFPPFFLLANVDIWIEKDGPPKTLEDMVDPVFYCRYGRPHWGALAQHFREGRFEISHMMDLARFKLLGGNDSFEVLELHRIPAAALAILGIRVCIDMVPQCQLSQDLVAQHMRVLYHISASRDAVFTGYFSEPVLVQAAGQLTNMVVSDGSPAWWIVFLRALVQSLKNVQVNAGFRGELVARILLILAWDKCCLADIAPGESHLSAVYLKPVLLTKFLDSLLCLDDETRLELEKKFNNDQICAWVRCTHFVKIDYVPDKAQLLELFRRGGAVVTKELQAGTDLIIPIIFCKNNLIEVTADMVSCIFVQVKNRKESDPGYPQTATVLQTPQATGVKISEVHPYLSLYMSLGPKLSPDGLVIEILPKRHHETRYQAKCKAEEDEKKSGCSGSQDMQNCLAVFTLSGTVYKPLVGNDELQRLLDIINRSWVDPVALQDSDKDGLLIARMLPLQCRGPISQLHLPPSADSSGTGSSRGSGGRSTGGRKRPTKILQPDEDPPTHGSSASLPHAHGRDLRSSGKKQAL